MMTRNRFRLLLLCSLLAAAMSLSARFYWPSWYADKPANAGAFAGAHPIFALAALILTLLGVLTGAAGLSMFRRWGRPMALCATVATFACIPLCALRTSNPIEAMLSDVAILLWGMTLALAYWGPCKSAFEAGSDVEAKTAPMTPLASLVPPPAADPADAIHFAGTLSRKAFARLQHALLPWWARPQMYFVYLLVYEIALNDLLGRLWRRPLEALIESLPLLGLVLLVLSIVYLLQRFQYRKALAMMGALSGTLTPEAVEWRTQMASSTFSWDKFIRVRKVDEMLLLHYHRRCALFFAPHFFDSDAAWRAFAALAERQVVPKARASG